MSSRFQQTGSRIKHEGKIADVYERTFRHEDGEEVTREVLDHPGAVGILAYDDDVIYLVRQPREAVGVPDLLEIPAGKLDEAGEEPLETAKRELAEEVGLAAEHWEHLCSFFTSPGFTNEEVHLYLATGLSESGPADVEENERIDIVTQPLDALGEAIAETRDSKSLIGLLMLRDRLAGR
jgi:8-oxo-dGTP pyrophosphatase MutT (NUDIX family)